MWVKILSQDSDLWYDGERLLQPQIEQKESHGRLVRTTLGTLPPLVGKVGKVMKRFEEEDGAILAVHVDQPTQLTCPSDYWFFRENELEEIPGGDLSEAQYAVMISWMR